jgi:integrase/recombinase XerD
MRTTANEPSGALRERARRACLALAELGYGERSVAAYAKVLSDMELWLERQGMARPTKAAVRAFIAYWRDGGPPLKGLPELSEYLVLAGATCPGALSEAAKAVQAYRAYMRQEQCLSKITVTGNSNVARRFLLWRAAAGRRDLGGIGIAELHAFVAAEAGRLKLASLKTAVGALSSFLAYLFSSGTIATDLSGALPRAAARGVLSPPRAAPAPTIARLLQSCDRSRPTGLRNFAVLMLMARLGLRANEIASMALEDIDWGRGELAVHGKGGRAERLPLPADVGEALAAYLSEGRRSSACRAVFLSARPKASPMSRYAVVMVPRQAARRCGLADVGGHSLRHALASAMLGEGASMAEVAQVLRHSDQAVTATYAKVDRSRLGLVVRPWPKVGQ